MILPKLGLTMDEGRIVAWHHAEGDTVREGDVLFEVETDKATMEVAAPASGILRRILVDADRSAPVAELVGLIADTPDEPVDRPSASAVSDAPATERAAAPLASERVSPSLGPPSLSSPSSSDRVVASPAARKRAAELGVDLGAVRPGRGARITTEDVEAAAAATAGPGAGERRTPLSRMRHAIAAAMTRSAREAPQFSIERDVDMTAADTLRRKAGVSYTDVLVSAAARALAAHPRFRARYEDDALVESSGVHIGLAVALEDGLIVPVIRDADRKDLVTLAREREALEAAARAGRLPAGAVSGAVFSISNLGPLGVDRFTALVNPPEAAILAVGRVRDRAVVHEGAPIVRPIATLALSVDHRVADGADAARFLADLARELGDEA